MGLSYFDAHNHLQDGRFEGRQDEIVAACRAAGVAAMVVNGSCEQDWPKVQALARRHAGLVIPSFGYHPWYCHERTADWERHLAGFLDSQPSALGEIGLDRWKPGLNYEGQEEVFTRQIRLAAMRDLPASIHCLRAWGRLLELLRAGPRPACGFLLHSFGGPAEMVGPLAALGAYFSFPGFFAHARKARQRETFRLIPLDRLLIETDAPDQPLPEEQMTHRVDVIPEPGGRSLNHPANLAAVYQFVSEFLAVPLPELVEQVAANGSRLFGGMTRGSA